jgi:hypothetical protein
MKVPSISKRYSLSRYTLWNKGKSDGEANTQTGKRLRRLELCLALLIVLDVRWVHSTSTSPLQHTIDGSSRHAKHSRSPKRGGKSAGYAPRRVPAHPYREHPRPQMNAAKIAPLTTVQLTRTYQIYLALFIHTPVWVAIWGWNLPYSLLSPPTATLRLKYNRTLLPCLWRAGSALSALASRASSGKYPHHRVL